MGSGGSQTLWSPSNEACALGFNRCRARYVYSVVIWLEAITTSPTLVFSSTVIDGGTKITTSMTDAVTSTVIDGGTFKRDQSN